MASNLGLTGLRHCAWRKSGTGPTNGEDAMHHVLEGCTLSLYWLQWSDAWSRGGAEAGAGVEAGAGALGKGWGAGLGRGAGTRGWGAGVGHVAGVRGWGAGLGRGARARGWGAGLRLVVVWGMLGMSGTPSCACSRTFCIATGLVVYGLRVTGYPFFFCLPHLTPPDGRGGWVPHALSDLMDHSPQLLPSFRDLDRWKKRSVHFTHCNLCFNRGRFVQAEARPGATCTKAPGDADRDHRCRGHDPRPRPRAQRPDGPLPAAAALLRGRSGLCTSPTATYASTTDGSCRLRPGQAPPSPSSGRR